MAWPTERILFEQWKVFRERFLTVEDPTPEDFRMFREFLQGPAGPPGLQGPAGPIADQVYILRKFGETTESVTTGATWTPASTHEVGEYGTYTFFIINTGTASANIRLELSPNEVNWILYPSPGGNAVGAGGMLYFAMPLFAKYARIGYVSTLSGQNTTLDILLNAQG